MFLSRAPPLSDFRGRRRRSPRGLLARLQAPPPIANGHGGRCPVAFHREKKEGQEDVSATGSLFFLFFGGASRCFFCSSSFGWCIMGRLVMVGMAVVTPWRVREGSGAVPLLHLFLLLPLFRWRTRRSGWWCARVAGFLLFSFLRHSLLCSKDKGRVFRMGSGRRVLTGGPHTT